MYEEPRTLQTANDNKRKLTERILLIPSHPIPSCLPRDTPTTRQRSSPDPFRPVDPQSEMVSHTVLRCRVPPGPGMDGTGRVPIRVEVPLRSSSSIGLRRSSSTSSVAFDSGSRDRQQVDMFEYRCPGTSPSNSAPTVSRSGTPRVRKSRGSFFCFVRGLLGVCVARSLARSRAVPCLVCLTLLSWVFVLVVARELRRWIAAVGHGRGWKT